MDISKAYQRKIRENREQIGSGTLFEFLEDKPVLDLKYAKVKEIDSSTAKQVIKNYEWLGTMSATTDISFGLFIDNIILGVVCFSNSRAGGQYTLFKKPAICLSRGACVHYSPKNSSSFLIQNALRQIKVDKPTYVVAYSDFESGEIGQVYQSCSWYYLGEFQSIQWMSPDRRKYDMAHHRNIARQIDDKFKETKKLNPEVAKSVKNNLISKGWKIIKGTIRGRYAIVIGNNSKEKREMINLLIQNSKIYPKRNIYKEVM